MSDRQHKHIPAFIMLAKFLILKAPNREERDELGNRLLNAHNHTANDRPQNFFEALPWKTRKWVEPEAREVITRYKKMFPNEKIPDLWNPKHQEYYQDLAREVLELEHREALEKIQRKEGILSYFFGESKR